MNGKKDMKIGKETEARMKKSIRKVDLRIYLYIYMFP